MSKEKLTEKMLGILNIKDLKELESLSAYDFILNNRGETHIDAMWTKASNNKFLKHINKEQFIVMFKILNAKQFITMVMEEEEDEE